MRQAADLSVSLYLMDNRLYMKRPRNTVSLTTFTDVFEIPFWIVLVVVLIGLFAAFCCFGRFVRNFEKIGFGDSAAAVYLALIGEAIPVTGKVLSVRILVVCTCLTGALVSWGFNAGIVSVLTVDNSDFPIKTLKVSATLSGSTWFFWVFLAIPSLFLFVFVFSGKQLTDMHLK